MRPEGGLEGEGVVTEGVGLAAPESLKKCDCRRLGGGSDVKRKPHPYREIDFGFVPCVPCVRARRSGVGGREEKNSCG